MLYNKMLVKETDLQDFIHGFTGLILNMEKQKKDTTHVYKVQLLEDFGELQSRDIQYTKTDRSHNQTLAQMQMVIICAGLLKDISRVSDAENVRLVRETFRVIQNKDANKRRRGNTSDFTETNFANMESNLRGRKQAVNILRPMVELPIFKVMRAIHQNNKNRQRLLNNTMAGKISNMSVEKQRLLQELEESSEIQKQLRKSLESMRNVRNKLNKRVKGMNTSLSNTGFYVTLGLFALGGLSALTRYYDCAHVVSVLLKSRLVEPQPILESVTSLSANVHSLTTSLINQTPINLAMSASHVVTETTREVFRLGQVELLSMYGGASTLFVGTLQRAQLMLRRRREMEKKS
jgi:hypothetical protein